jgi:hypothetical protein
MIFHDSSLEERVPSEYWMGKSGMTRPAVGIGLDALVLLFDVLTLDALGSICSVNRVVGTFVLIGMMGVVEMLKVARCDMSIVVAVYGYPFED